MEIIIGTAKWKQQTETQGNKAMETQSYCFQWKLGYFMGSRRKHSKDPHRGDCSVARWFIHVSICPWEYNDLFPSVLPWKKSNLVLSNATSKAKVQHFPFILKVNSLEPWQLLDPHGCMHPVQREHANKQGSVCYQVRDRERGRQRGRELFCFPGII